MTPRDAAQRVQIRGHTDVGRYHVWVAAAIALRMPDVVFPQLSSPEAQTQRKTTNGHRGTGPHGAHPLELPARVRWLLTAVGEDSHSVSSRKRVGENPGVSAMTSVIVKVMNDERNLHTTMVNCWRMLSQLPPKNVKPAAALDNADCQEW